MSILAKRYTPESVVTFSTETGDIVLRSKLTKEGDSIDGSVLSINTNNDLQSDAATFQIQLSSNVDWEKSLASNDLVRIKMARQTEDSDDGNATVMLGLIDDVRKGVVIQGGSPQRVITVTGRSFAKALINFEIGTVQEMDMSLNGGWLLGRIKFAQQSSASIVQQLLEEFVFKYMNYEFNNGETLETLTNTELTSRTGELLYDETSFASYQGSIWAFIREIINEPFNQVFWDCYGGKNTLVVRETPFNKPNWEALVTHRITDVEVVSDNFGRSDVETYTLFSVGMQSYFSSFDVNKTMNVFPYWYEPHFKKYGLRRLNRFTGYIGLASSEDIEAAKAPLRAYQKDLYNWNIMNPSFLNGDLSVKGENGYKVGDKLIYTSDEHNDTFEFFIEGVSHDFVNFSYWITKLSITRGLPEAGKARFSEPWDSFSEYDPTALGSPSLDYNPDAANGGSNSQFPSMSPGGGSATGIAASIISTGQTFIGRTKYSFGGGRTAKDIANGLFDCSSWLHHVYTKLHGVNIGAAQTDSIAKAGSNVSSVSDLKPGDIVFFNTYKYNGHCMIYMGNGKVMGCNTSTGVAIGEFDYWQKTFGLGSMRRYL